MAAPNPFRSLSQAQRLAILRHELAQIQVSLGGMFAIEALVRPAPSGDPAADEPDPLSIDRGHLYALLALLSDKLGDQIGVAIDLVEEAAQAAEATGTELFQVHPRKE